MGLFDMNRYLLVSVAALVLSACAAQSPPPTPEEQALSIAAKHKMIAQESQGAVTVKTAWGWFSEQNEPYGKYLHIIHPSHSTKVVALKTLGFLLGGSYQGSDKKDLKGDTIKQVINPSPTYAYRPVRDYVFATYAKKSDKPYFPVYVSARILDLVYEKYNGGKNGKYELRSVIEFVKSGERGGVFQHICSQGGVLKTLPEWEANNYRQVHETAAFYAKKCAEELFTNPKAKQDLDNAFERE